METLTLKNTLTKIKNSINRFKSKLEAEERISELKGKSIESIQINTQREKDEDSRKKP